MNPKFPNRQSAAAAAARRASAFTLIELMIALVLFTMVVGAVYSTWTLIMRASRVSQEASAQVQRERIAIRTIENAMTCIQSFEASMKYYSFVVSQDPPEFQFTARVPDNFPRNGKFDGLNVRQLDFTLAPGADSDRAETDLVLRQKPILLEFDEEEQKTPLVLARYVQKFSVECWDTNRAEWVKAWTQTNIIPPLIRVKLVLGNNKNNSYGSVAPTLSVTRIVAVPSETMPAAVETGNTPPGQPPGTPLGGVPINKLHF